MSGEWIGRHTLSITPSLTLDIGWFKGMNVVHWRGFPSIQVVICGFIEYQVIACNNPVIAEHDGSLNDVFKLTNVAGPGVSQKLRRCLRRQLKHAIFTAVFDQKVISERQNIVQSGR